MSDIAKQLEEIRKKKSFEYNKKLEEEELREQKIKDDIKLKELLQKKEEQEIIKHQEYLDNEIKSPEIINNNINDDLEESFLIINNIFKDNINVRELLNNFYQKLNHDNLYIFYISITEIIYNEISYDIIINILSLLDIDVNFIDYLVEIDKLNDIKIIFKEFIKLIESIKSDIIN